MALDKATQQRCIEEIQQIYQQAIADLEGLKEQHHTLFLQKLHEIEEQRIAAIREKIKNS